MRTEEVYRCDDCEYETTDWMDHWKHDQVHWEDREAAHEALPWGYLTQADRAFAIDHWLGGYEKRWLEQRMRAAWEAGGFARAMVEARAICRDRGSYFTPWRICSLNEHARGKGIFVEYANADTGEYRRGVVTYREVAIATGPVRQASLFEEAG